MPLVNKSAEKCKQMKRFHTPYTKILACSNNTKKRIERKIKRKEIKWALFYLKKCFFPLLVKNGSSFVCRINLLIIYQCYHI